MGSTAAPPDEARALRRLGLDELDGAIGGIRATHRAIADRAFGASGSAARPAQVLHDAIAGAVYGGVRGAGAVTGHVLDALLPAAAGPSGRSISTTPRGAAALAALTGLRGDSLRAEGSDLQEPMAIRVGGRAVPADIRASEGAFRDAGPFPVLFLHGLMETEHSWRRGAAEHGGTYGSRLAEDSGATPVYLRYNSGLHISENGAELDALMEELVESWPAEIDRVALVGHSMGGLVARGACHRAVRRGARWPGLVRHVVCLGSPHAGAPLEQTVHVASAGLHALPETRALGALLRRRSAGIRDLRHGSLVDEDWRGRDPDSLRARAVGEVPLLEGATHCFVSATVTRSAKHPLGRAVGDWLVLPPSAEGRRPPPRPSLRADHHLHVGAAHHFALLNHPAVYERLREWLAVPAPAATVPAAVGTVGREAARLGPA